MEYKKEENQLVNQNMFIWRNEEKRTVQGFLLFPENIPDIKFVKDLLMLVYKNKEIVKLTVWYDGEIVQLVGRIYSFRYAASKISFKDMEKRTYHMSILDIVEVVRKVGNN